jgi:hypothetical protein
MIVYTSLFLMLFIILTSSRVHERSLFKKVFDDIFNKLQCDIHDMIVRNFNFSIKIYI